MVDSVDKSITEKTTVEVPGADELVQEQQEKIEKVQTEGGPVEIEMDQEGGAQVSFDPNAVDPITGEPLAQGDLGDIPQEPDLEKDGAITDAQLSKDTKSAEI